MLDPSLEQLFAMLIPGCAELNNTSDTETDTGSEVAMFLAPMSPITAICKPPTRKPKPKPKPKPSPDGVTGATRGEIEKLLHCVCLRESCGDKECDKCVSKGPTAGAGATSGDHGRAIGPFQIHAEFFEDGTNEGGKSPAGTKPPGTYPASCENYDYSKDVVRNYWARWGSGYSVECLARLHNGGLNCGGKYPAAGGSGNDKTDPYWENIQACMSKTPPPPALPSIP